MLTGVLLLLAALGCRREEPPPTAVEAPEARSAGRASAGPSGSGENGVRRDPWREAQSRGVEFRAVGQEPGWYLEIDGDRSMRLVYDYGERTIETNVTRTTDPAGSTVYRSTDEPDVVVTVEDGACRDVMSGQPFPSAVTVAIAPGADEVAARRDLRGCGRSPAADARWTASAHGVGPVRVGMTVAEAESAIGASFGPVGNEPDECVYRRSPAVPPGLLFMQRGDRLARVDITSFAVRTDQGIGVGDSEDRVREAYGAAVESSPHKYTPGGHDLTVAADANHRIVFETDGQWVTRYRVGRIPEVDWVEGCS